MQLNGCRQQRVTGADCRSPQKIVNRFLPKPKNRVTRSFSETEKVDAENADWKMREKETY